MTIEKHKMPVEGYWHECPSCGHEGGWHVFFKRTRDPKVVHMDLQCPNCKTQVDLGISVSLE